MTTKKNILVSPLNWGLGHASRLVSVIKELQNLGHNVIIGGNGVSIDLLKEFFPKLEYVFIPSNVFIYGKRKSFTIPFYFSFIKFTINVFKEHFALKRIIKKHNINAVISDNRLGLYNKNIKSIYISHQLNIYTKEKQKRKSFWATYLNQYFIKKYDYCWIPDIENKEKSLTGRLSENANKLNSVFIGTISRFDNYHQNINNHIEKKYDYICLLSGPEPQRSILENIIISKFENTTQKIVILRGLPKSNVSKQNTENITFLNHSDDETLLNYIIRSKKIICRSGYSTIMDILSLNRRAILVSTPKQPEQEYIASRLSKNYGFIKIDQKNLHNINLSELNYEDFCNFDNDKISLQKIIETCL